MEKFYNEVKNKLIFFVPLIMLFLHVYFFPNIHVGFAVFTFLYIILYRRDQKIRSLSLEKEKLNKLLDTLFEKCPDFIFIKDTNSRYIGVNKSFAEFLQIESQEEFCKKTDYELTTKEVADMRLLQDKEVINERKTIIYDSKIEIAGKEYILEVVKSPLTNEKNEVLGIVGIVRDVTRVRMINKKLQTEQLMLDSIIDNLPFVAFLRDLHGNVLRSNKYCEVMFDKTTHSTPADAYKNFFRENINEILEIDKKIFETEQVAEIRKEFLIDGRNFYLEVHKIPLFNQENKIDRMLIVAKDITFEKQIEDQKDTFVATLAHDLKTPTIAQIKAIEYLLNNGSTALNKNDKEILSEVYNSCKYMNSLINNLVMTYNYTSGRIVLNYDSFNLAELLNEACNETRFLTGENSDNINFEIDESECVIYADRLEIKRVLINLLSNAVSYSCPKSPVTVKIKDVENYITFSISNFSRYPMEDDINLIFDKYSYARKNISIGSGLGLYLSKQIIEAHGGEIFAKKEAELCIFGFTFYKDKMESRKESYASNNESVLPE